MEKVDMVAAAVQALQAAEAQAKSDAFSAFYDQVAAVVTPAPGGFTQEQVDAMVGEAVAAAKAEDAQALSDAQAADAKAMADAKAVADAAMTELQAKFDALAVKEGQESSVIVGLQNSKAQIQSVLDALMALAPVAAAPVPASDPAPAEPTAPVEN